ncbi:MAG: Serine/threonine-protein kinase tousled-like 2, partial [Paramarteilia canceri]
KQKYLAAEKEDLEKQKRQLLKRKASINSNLQQMISQNSNNNSNSGGGNNSSNSNPDPSYFSEQQKLIEVCEAEELLKIKFSALRKEDNDISIDLERVERERLLHSREINRLHNQDNSR